MLRFQLGMFACFRLPTRQFVTQGGISLILAGKAREPGGGQEQEDDEKLSGCGHGQNQFGGSGAGVPPGSYWKTCVTRVFTCRPPFNPGVNRHSDSAARVVASNSLCVDLTTCAWATFPAESITNSTVTDPGTLASRSAAG